MDKSLVIAGLHQIKQEEIEQIEAASIIARNKVCEHISKGAAFLKQASEQLILSVHITEDDLSKFNYQTTMGRLGRLVANGVRNAGQNVVLQMVMELHQELAGEINRLYTFAVTIDQLMTCLELPAVKEITKGELVSFVEYLKTSWSTYNDGGKNASITFIRIGEFMAAFMISEICQLLTEKEPGDLKKNNVEQFKRSYLNEVNSRIDKHWYTYKTNVEHSIIAHVNNTFSWLKYELDVVIEQYQLLLSNNEELSLDIIDHSS